MTIALLPTPPTRNDPSNFAERADAFLAALPNFATQANAVASQSNNAAGTASTAATNAANSAIAAAASAVTAANSSGAPQWVSGTNYALNAVVFSPINARIYRRVVAGAGTTDPSLDGTNWRLQTVEAEFNGPDVSPIINFNFAQSRKFDNRIFISRTTEATYYDGVSYTSVNMNQIPFSYTMSSGWITTGATATYASDIAPDGTQNATRVIATATTTPHQINLSSSGNGAVSYQTTNAAPSTVNLPYVFSCFVKKGTLAGAPDIVQLLCQDTVNISAFANFNIVTGAVTRQESVLGAGIINYGNGWFRIWIKFTVPSTVTGSGGFLTMVNNNPTANRNPSYLGATNQDLYTAFWQVEVGDLTDYTPTGDGLPFTQLGNGVGKMASSTMMKLVRSGGRTGRIDHDPLTKECYGFLTEPQRTNLLWANTDFTQSVWGTSNATRLNNIAVAPDGTITATRLIEGTSNNGKNIFTINNSTLEIPADLNHTFSIYVKQAPGQERRVRIGAASTLTSNDNAFVDFSFGERRFTQQGFVNGSMFTVEPDSAKFQELGAGWFRISFTFRVNTSTQLLCSLQLVNLSGTAFYTGDGWSGVYTWGWQLEQGDVVSSLIYTPANASATRTAEQAFFFLEDRPDDGQTTTKRLNSDLTVAFAVRNRRYRMPTDLDAEGSFGRVIQFRGTGSANQTFGSNRNSGNSVDMYSGVSNQRGQNIFRFDTSPSRPDGQRAVMVVAVSPTSARQASNGVLGGTSDTFGMTSSELKTLHLGSGSGNSQNQRLLGTIEYVEIYDKRLPNEVIRDMSLE